MTYLMNLCFQLPSTRLFIMTLLGDLVQWRSLLVLLPPWIEDEDVWYCLREELMRREYDYIREISLPDLSQKYLPALALAEALGVKIDSAIGVGETISERILEAERKPEIIYLRDFGNLSEAARGAWIQFLMQWATV